MADSHGQEAQRERIEQVAAGLVGAERRWLELHARRSNSGEQRWIAVVCRPQDAAAMLEGTSEAGVIAEFDDPARLGRWLESLRVRAVHPLPGDPGQLVLFGCDVEMISRASRP